MFLLFSAIEFKAETKVEYNLPTQYDVGDCAVKQPSWIPYYNKMPNVAAPIPFCESQADIEIIGLADKYGLKNINTIFQFVYNRLAPAPTKCSLLVPWQYTMPSYYLATKKQCNYFALYGLAN